MSDKKKRSYSDINRKYSFLNEGVEGLKKNKFKMETVQDSSKKEFHESQQKKASQNRKKRATLREEKRRIMQEQRDLGHTVVLNPQEIEFERRRIEALQKRRKEEELRKKRQRNNRIFFGIVTLLIVVLLAILLRNFLARRAQENEQAAQDNAQIQLQETPQGDANTVSTQLLGFNKTGEDVVLYGETTEETKLGEIPGNTYVKNFGVEGDYTKVKHLDQEGYVKTSSLVSIEDPNQLKVDKGILLVNDEFTLPQDYDPGLDVDALKAFEIMAENAKADNIIIKSASDYRNYKQQSKSVSGSANDYGEYKADSSQLDLGASEHQTGLAFDVMGEDYEKKYGADFGQSQEANWLRNNAYKYGFIERYPEGKEAVTGRRAEPWHYRYVGVDVAQEIYRNQWTLEEYLNGSTAPTTINQGGLDNTEEDVDQESPETTEPSDNQNQSTQNNDNTDNSGINNEEQGQETTPGGNEGNTQNNSQGNIPSNNTGGIENTNSQQNTNQNSNTAQ